ncbi:MAG: hypothetical protein JWN86_4674 [Planctomycetota bacterium]|nr:hypothetical protein [Planctomycetota bacterium]
MRRTSAAGSWGLVLALAATAAAGEDPPPPLTPPADAPPVLEAPGQPATPGPAPAPPVVVPRTPPASRTTSSLLRPRTAARTVPAPAARPRNEPPVSPTPPPFSAVPEATDAPPPLDGPPPLDAPPEFRPLPDRPLGGRSTRRTGSPAANPFADAPPSLVLEPSQPGDLEPLPDGADPKTGRNAAKGEKIPDNPPASSRRPSRRLGLFATPAGRARAGASAEPALRVEPRSDPAADAALKRRLEAKVKEAVGDRARDVEVRVVDRNIVVRARVDRFWNRRPVRRTIEALPALAGYKAKVEIED